MIKRPKVEETDEDLLAQQEEFYKSLADKCINPAARLISTTTPYKREEPKNDPDQIETVPNVSIVPSSVMGEIVEKNFNVPEGIQEQKFGKSKTGFPQATRRQIGGSSHSKGSIFARQMAKKSVLQPSSSNTKISSIEPNTTSKSSSSSFILSGPESQKIHEENTKILSQMDHEEIITERAKLLESLDPKLVEFLASRRSKVEKMDIDNENNTKNQVEVHMDDVLDVPNILSDAQSNKWLHFDNLEPEKFEWMKKLTKPAQLKAGEPYEARFDFDGWLQPYAEEDGEAVTEKTRVLYHHGDDPGRPGYTLQELLHLCRSSVIQQRILALNTLGNILSLFSTGVYDGVLELPVEQIFFVVRFALDENNVPVISAAIFALANIFCSQVDEICLDSLLGFNCGLLQPILQYDVAEKLGSDGKTKSEKTKDEELNDQQMAETDLIKCLLRTDILIRIRYILLKIQPPAEVVNVCMGLLIRIARDSHYAFASLVNCEDLLETIINQFIPKSSTVLLNSSQSSHKMFTIVLKLLRVIVARSFHMAQLLIEKHNLFEKILLLLHEDAPCSSLIKLQTEALFLAATFMQYKIFPSSYHLSFQSILLRILNFHIRATNITETSSYLIHSHGAAVICVLTQLGFKFEHTKVEPFVVLISEAFAKWTSQTGMLKAFKCGHLQIISSILKCGLVFKNYLVQNRLIEDLIKSDGFLRITEKIKSGSNLLCGHKPHETKAALDSVNASIWDNCDHVVPILSSKSCLPFLNSLSQLLRSYNDLNSNLLFLRHPNIGRYFKQISQVSTYYLTSNWFSRIEISFIINCVLIANSVKMQLTDEEKSIVYRLAFKSIHIFGKDLKDDIGILMNDIIFSREYFPLESLISQMSVGDKIQAKVQEILSRIGDIREFYLTALGFKKMEFIFSSSYALKHNAGGFLPNDWIYLPIVAIYSNSESAQIFHDGKTSLTLCLEWINVFDILFPTLSNYVNITERFCRISCIFLLDNSLFLESNINQLLEMCLRTMISNEAYFKHLNFDSEIKGLTGFQDFYTLLLEQYQGVSYGNAVFANYILIPLTQRHNVKWRKMVWSEYIGVTQSINIDENELLISLNEFLEPNEKDQSLLKCYRRAVQMGHLRRSPLLKRIAEYHVKRYINYLKNK